MMGIIISIRLNHILVDLNKGGGHKLHLQLWYDLDNFIGNVSNGKSSIDLFEFNRKSFWVRNFHLGF